METFFPPLASQRERRARHGQPKDTFLPPSVPSVHGHAFLMMGWIMDEHAQSDTYRGQVTSVLCPLDFHVSSYVLAPSRLLDHHHQHQHQLQAISWPLLHSSAPPPTVPRLMGASLRLSPVVPGTTHHPFIRLTRPRLRSIGSRTARTHDRRERLAPRHSSVLCDDAGRPRTDVGRPLPTTTIAVLISDRDSDSLHVYAWYYYREGTRPQTPTAVWERETISSHGAGSAVSGQLYLHLAPAAHRPCAAAALQHPAKGSDPRRQQHRVAQKFSSGWDDSRLDLQGNANIMALLAPSRGLSRGYADQIGPKRTAARPAASTRPDQPRALAIIRPDKLVCRLLAILDQGPRASSPRVSSLQYPLQIDEATIGIASVRPHPQRNPRWTSPRARRPDASDAPVSPTSWRRPASGHLFECYDASMLRHLQCSLEPGCLAWRYAVDVRNSLAATQYTGRTQDAAWDNARRNGFFLTDSNHVAWWSDGSCRHGCHPPGGWPSSPSTRWIAEGRCKDRREASADLPLARTRVQASCAREDTSLSRRSASQQQLNTTG
ncbi:hypothetical protein CMUS01_14521 [Colletotrichum musicola]|uniref:Uncharacterized protein n=1 Tax=Colletotrichum musicola TaxID=2175873 RepID=A0A8H6J491_9PEZI|nr:hypothetical protein CMUS01_14521 [Colletotrichum musicola]